MYIYIYISKKFKIKRKSILNKFLSIKINAGFSMNVKKYP